MRKEGFLSISNLIEPSNPSIDYYCVLEKGVLSWYESKPCVNIIDSLFVHDSSHEIIDEKTFQVTNKDGNQRYQFTAWDEGEANEWVVSFTNAKSNSTEKTVKPTNQIDIGRGASIPQLIKAMKVGNTLSKYRNGRFFATSYFWLSDFEDRIIWGENNKKKVRGFMKIKDILELKEVQVKNKMLINLISHDAILEIEPIGHIAWDRGLTYLVAQSMSPSQKIEPIRSELVQLYHSLLLKGDLFKKSSRPGGRFQLRMIWCSQTMNKLQWANPQEMKVKGYINMKEIVDVERDKTSPNIFSIHSMFSSPIYFEAVSSKDCELFVKALQHFLAMDV